MTAYAAIARDRSDAGAIAVMYEYVIRALRAKIGTVAESATRDRCNDRARRPRNGFSLCKGVPVETAAKLHILGFVLPRQQAG